MSKTFGQSRTRLIFDPIELAYDFGTEHPFQPRRLVATIELLESSGLWQRDNEQTSLPLREAAVEELHLNHTLEYIDAVQHLSRTADAFVSEDEHEERLRPAQKYGFGETDTPVMPGMHEVTASIVGGTLVALSAVMGLPEGGISSSEEECPLHVYHPAGGLHHALADRASGMCIYNDISVAIAHVLRATEAKILFLDFDAHHGTGVQRSFYDDPRVMTISLHENGRTLFPGAGNALELGERLGRGYSVNVSLEPFTDDDSYVEVMRTISCWHALANVLISRSCLNFSAACTVPPSLSTEW
jgi:acetoin utilization deacetylase AcuC-like enzyme